MENWDYFINESAYIDFSTFETKDSLDRNFWSEDEQKLDPEIIEKLTKIAEDFFKSLKLTWVGIADITFTGSLANYNWSEYSDIDLHIIVDFKQVDENVTLVREYFHSKTAAWNMKHKIMIRGHEVEIYIQELSEPHFSTGVYSLTYDKWNVRPSKVKAIIDEASVYKKASYLSRMIDDVEDLFFQTDYREAYKQTIELKRKIKKFRKCGLEKAGEYSVENLAFKALRRNGYLKKLSDLQISAYDKIMSLNGKFKTYVSM